MAYFDDSKTNATVDELRRKEEERAIKSRAAEYGYGYVNLSQTKTEPYALKLIDEEAAREARVAIFNGEGQNISLAVCDPKDPHLPIIINLLTARGYAVHLFLVSEQSLENAWEAYKTPTTASAQKHGILDIDPSLIKNLMDSIKTSHDASEKISGIGQTRTAHQTSLLISTIFGGAVALNASDIHIEPEATLVRVRYRIDGVLTNIADLDKDVSVHIVPRLKLLAGVKLNVRKEAQDGRFTFSLGTRNVEVRTSVIPGAYGESLVMRLLDPDASSFVIENLGLSARMREVIDAELKRPNGAILTTGPTGSGKTTALYSFLNAIHTPDIKIITLEDPVEYKLPGIVQTQVTKDYSFELGLRTILRQDPDVILVGEIRDRDVAETAMQAALTGHLVLSTLHTNSAVGAISRLLNFGIDPQTIGNACNVILGQRLVRKLCTACREEREMTTEETKLVHRILTQPTSIHTLFHAKGCDACGGSGYKGRIGVYEAIQMDARVKEALSMDTREHTILEAAKEQNIPTMQQDGVMKALNGITTLEEVSRVLDLYHV